MREQGGGLTGERGPQCTSLRAHTHTPGGGPPPYPRPPPPPYPPPPPRGGRLGGGGMRLPRSCADGGGNGGGGGRACPGGPRRVARWRSSRPENPASSCRRSRRPGERERGARWRSWSSPRRRDGGDGDRRRRSLSRRRPSSPPPSRRSSSPLRRGERDRRRRGGEAAPRRSPGERERCMSRARLVGLLLSVWATYFFFSTLPLHCSYSTLSLSAPTSAPTDTLLARTRPGRPVWGGGRGRMCVWCEGKERVRRGARPNLVPAWGNGKGKPISSARPARARFLRRVCVRG